jgi:hypothetical protein
MSYRNAVLRDNPTGFWHLNGTSSQRTYASILLEYATYSDWLNNESSYGQDVLSFTVEDISNRSNHGSFILGSPNFLDILPLATLSSKDVQLAGCKIGTNSLIAIPNLPILTDPISSYKMFYTGTENLAFTAEFWLGFDINPAGDNTVFSVVYNSFTIAKAYINNDRLYFTVNGKDKTTNSNLSYTTYQQVNSWDSQNHIIICYNDGNIYTIINGVKGNTITLSNNFIFSNSSDYADNFYYHIGPAFSNFVINDLAFYDYELSNNSIKTHIAWGLYDSSPQTQSKTSNSFFFDIKQSKNMLSFDKDFSDSKRYSEGVLNNLIIDSSGITLNQIPSLSQAGTGSINVSSSGLSITNSASALLLNASKYFPLTKMSIMGQINWTQNTGGYESIILSINNVGNGGWVYLGQSFDNKLTLYYYSQSSTSPYSYTKTILAQVPTAITTTGTTYNFGLSINSNTASIYISAPSGTNYATTVNFPVYANSQYDLYFGNEYSAATTLPLSGTIKNISLFADEVNPRYYSSYGSFDSTTITFNNTLAISQKGTWTYSVPASFISNIVGSRVVWDSACSDDTINSLNKYVKIDMSLDYGNTWYQIKNGYPATKFLDSATLAYGDIILKATIFNNDSSYIDQPRLEKLNISLYKDLSITSDSGAFILSPRMGNYVSDTYSIKKNFFNILSRTDNFGIKLAKVNNQNSIATIKPGSYSSMYQTIDFWFRPENVGPGQVQVILDTTLSPGVLYYNSTDNYVYQNGFSKVYINGVDISTGKALTMAESYHIVCVYATPSFSSIYLGGDQDLNNYTYGTYGFITMYSYAFTQTQAQTRYNSYISANTSQVASVGNNNLIGTLSEYSSSGSSFNSGLPLIAYNHPLV